MKRKPEFKVVKFGEIRAWGTNPREIVPEKLQALANSIKKYGMFRTLTCWKEGSHYVTGGGNMRFRAMTDILRWKASELINISVNYPETEAEKIELSFLDNQNFGFYDELRVYELIKARDDIEMEMLGVSLDTPLDLATVLEDLDDGEELAPLTDNEADIRAGRTRAPVGGELTVIGIGVYCCVILRTLTDPVVDALRTRFGDNRSEREVAGNWLCKLLKAKLVPEVGEPTVPPTDPKEFEDFRQKQKDVRKKVEDEEFKVWQRSQASTKAKGKGKSAQTAPGKSQKK